MFAQLDLPPYLQDEVRASDVLAVRATWGALLGGGVGAEGVLGRLVSPGEGEDGTFCFLRWWFCGVDGGRGQGLIGFRSADTPPHLDPLGPSGRLELALRHRGQRRVCADRPARSHPVAS